MVNLQDTIDFARDVLNIELHPWQVDVLTQYVNARTDGQRATTAAATITARRGDAPHHPTTRTTPNPKQPQRHAPM